MALMIDLVLAGASLRALDDEKTHGDSDNGSGLFFGDCTDYGSAMGYGNGSGSGQGHGQGGGSGHGRGVGRGFGGIRISGVEQGQVIAWR